MTGNVNSISSIVGNGIPRNIVNNYRPRKGPCGVIPPPPPCPDYCELVLVVEQINPINIDCWWECRCDGDGGGDGGGPVDPPTNACGCNLPANPNMPAGCIEVLGNNGVIVPVRIVRVEVWDWSWRFKQSDVVFTDRSGCWAVDREYSEHDLRVKFENDNLKVRDHGYILGTTVIRDNVGQFTEPPYNNNHIRYIKSCRQSALGWLAYT